QGTHGQGLNALRLVVPACFERTLCLIGGRSCLASFELIQRIGGKELCSPLAMFSQLPFVNTDLLPVRKSLIPLIKITLPQNVQQR
ncbi:MAG TPA: hypothetical protein VKA81_07095, partial [Verrucomicrobiae bacterium]|nr:hypothetical protein [Verrucomicrobiae bacterium]